MSTDTVCVFVEDPLYFRDAHYPQNFHTHKLVLHRASMRAYADILRNKGFTVHYLEYTSAPTPSQVMRYVRENGGTNVTVFNPTDFILEKRLRAAAQKHRCTLSIRESPNFVTPVAVLEEYFHGKKRYLMNNFYIFQRKRLGILLTKDNQPEGGAWNFDAENRKPLPKDISIPALPHFTHNAYVQEAIKYVARHFTHNPGNPQDFNYPVTHTDAQKLLSDFLEERFHHFGAYEDAIARDHTLLFHSMLSAPLNCGLLSPQQIIEAALAHTPAAPLPSREGFIRQIIGWREFMRAVYIFKGSEIRNANILNHMNTLSSAWYEGTTGILPVDMTVRRVQKHAYCHHIERLMILGNMMLLMRIHPTEVYRWFMDMFIDAYDWVMVPNVYAMSQYAPGNLITTKPYFSSSNYVCKMSDYPTGEWCDIWDALFYAFLANHRKSIESNPRLAVLLKNLDALSSEKKRRFRHVLRCVPDCINSSLACISL